MFEQPPHPGEVFRQLFDRARLTQDQMAKHLGVCRLSVNELYLCKRAVSPMMAVRLAKAFGTTPTYWLYMQVKYDLSLIPKTEGVSVKRLRLNAVKS